MLIKEDMIKCESVFTLVSFSDDFLKTVNCFVCHWIRKTFQVSVVTYRPHL